MTKTYIFNTIEDALNVTPVKDWPTSPHVSRTLLSCPRLRGIIRNLMMKRSVDVGLCADIQSEVALIMQMKMLAQLDSIKSVYFVAYRVAQLVIYNWGKKQINTYYTHEVRISEYASRDEKDQDFIDRHNTAQGLYHDGSEAEKGIDKVLARRRLAKKLSVLGWPEEVARERKRIGRPEKIKTAEVSKNVPA